MLKFNVNKCSHLKSYVEQDTDVVFAIILLYMTKIIWGNLVQADVKKRLELLIFLIKLHVSATTSFYCCMENVFVRASQRIYYIPENRHNHFVHKQKNYISHKHV